MLVRGETERFAWSEAGAARLPVLFDAWAAEPEADAKLKAVLKLAVTLRERHRSPSAAAAIESALLGAPSALRRIARLRRSRPMVAPGMAKRAPQFGAIRPEGSQPMRALLGASQHDLQAARLRRLHERSRS